MRKLAFSFLLILLGIQSFGQLSTPTPLSEEYLRMSRSQKRSGWIALGAGTVLLAAAASSYQVNFNLGGASTGTDNAVATMLAFSGAAGIVVSIACFNASHNYRKKAALLTLTNQPVLIPHQELLASKTQPAICLRVAL